MPFLQIQSQFVQYVQMIVSSYIAAEETTMLPVSCINLCWCYSICIYLYLFDIKASIQKQQQMLMVWERVSLADLIHSTVVQRFE